MQRVFLSFLFVIALSCTAKAIQVDTVRLQLPEKEQVGKLPTLIFNKMIMCSKDECLFNMLEKVKAFSPASFVMMAKVDGKWSMEKDGSSLPTFLKAYAPKAVSIGEGGITIAGVKHPDKQYVVFIE